MLNLPHYSIGFFAIVLCIGLAATVHQPIIATATAGNVQIGAEMIDRDSVPILNRVPDFSMVDQRGTEISSVDLYGHIWIANLMSTQCKDACVAKLNVMRTLQGSLREFNNWEHIRLISIGVDPDNDTSESLADYIIENDLDTTQWHFLSGTRSSIQRLSEGGLTSPMGDDIKGIDV
ncbi:MAG: SCO family protein, partial [Woeseiaceae bacterium]